MQPQTKKHKVIKKKKNRLEFALSGIHSEADAWKWGGGLLKGGREVLSAEMIVSDQI